VEKTILFSDVIMRIAIPMGRVYFGHSEMRGLKVQQPTLSPRD
jgi:hypothetical protein